MVNGEQKNWGNAAKLLGLFSLIAIVVIAMVVPQTSLFQGNLTAVSTITDCKKITLKSIPTPLLARESATIIIETDPANWGGTFRVSSSEGSLSDPNGQNGALIESTEKVLSYSGGDAGSRITVQAEGEKNEACVGTLDVLENEKMACDSLEIQTYPEALMANESAELTLVTTPENWEGSFIIETDSGKLQLTSGDTGSQGENTNILVTSSRKVLYNGGKAGEKISIKALGVGNDHCQKTLSIEAS